MSKKNRFISFGLEDELVDKQQGLDETTDNAEPPVANETPAEEPPVEETPVEEAPAEDLEIQDGDSEEVAEEKTKKIKIEIEIAQESISKGIDAIASLEKICNEMQNTLQAGGLDVAGRAIAKTTVNHFTKSLKLKNDFKSSLEDYDYPLDNFHATRVSIEGIKDTVLRIIKFIKDMIVKVIDFIFKRATVRKLQNAQNRMAMKHLLQIEELTKIAHNKHADTVKLREELNATKEKLAIAIQQGVLKDDLIREVQKETKLAESIGIIDNSQKWQIKYTNILDNVLYINFLRECKINGDSNFVNFIKLHDVLIRSFTEMQHTWANIKSHEFANPETLATKTTYFKSFVEKYHRNIEGGNKYLLNVHTEPMTMYDLNAIGHKELSEITVKVKETQAKLLGSIKALQECIDLAAREAAKGEEVNEETLEIVKLALKCHTTVSNIMELHIGCSIAAAATVVEV